MKRAILVLLVVSIVSLSCNLQIPFAGKEEVFVPGESTSQTSQDEPLPQPPGQFLGLEVVSAYGSPQPASAVYVSDTYAYVVSREGDLQVVDISKPTSPHEVGFFEAPPDAYDVPLEGKDVHVSGSYVYLTTGGFVSGLYVIDVSNPASPIPVGFYSLPTVAGGATLALYVSGSYAYIAADYSGLLVIDVSNPGSPHMAGSFDHPPTLLPPKSFPRGDAWDVYVSGSVAYVAAGWPDGGLWIVDVANPLSPKALGFYDTSEYVTGVFVSASYAYLAAGDILRVIDISNPTDPLEVGRFATSATEFRDVFISGSYAYVIDWGDLRVLDISNPADPYEVTYFETPGHAEDIYIDGSYVYIADWDRGLLVLRMVED